MDQDSFEAQGSASIPGSGLPKTEELTVAQERERLWRLAYSTACAGNASDYCLRLIQQMAEDEGATIQYLRPPSGWQPIRTAPHQKNLLLFAVTDHDPYNWKMDTGYFSNASKCWIWSGYEVKSYLIQPTHWMPLPSPPDTQATGTGASPDLSKPDQVERSLQPSIPELQLKTLSEILEILRDVTSFRRVFSVREAEKR